ncbi:hypothetical protein HGP28_14270 [Vibrio sp. SM6]|uniref:Uncharacterized protein n=1 Tax=Vibrio agarilyticus TaxID=2726741 RepID=A0A7X8TSY4_9VIBR|nr:hypothetical protein [Vibrio agarilyticus]NLS14056.1 hypothetical protein [Vibrio agarilyticus]
MKVNKYLASTLAALLLVGCGDELPTQGNTGGGNDGNGNGGDVTPPPGPTLDDLNILSYGFTDWSNWSSGTVAKEINDATYGAAVQLTGGTDWGDMASSIAWGYLDQSTFNTAGYTHANFKVKSTSATTVEVAVTSVQDGDDKQLHQLSSGTALGNGWVQMQVPIETSSATTYFALTFTGADSVTIADIHLSQEEGTTTPPQPANDQFVLVGESASDTDMAFSDTTVQEWGTGTDFDGNINYLGQNSWRITSGPKTPEQGNWGAVLVFDDAFKKDLSEFNYLEVSIATEGGFDSYAVSIASDGVTQEITLPVDDTKHDAWQKVRVPMSDFALEFANVQTMAIMGKGGVSGDSTFHVADYQFIKTQTPEKDSDRASDFVIIDPDRTTSVPEASYGEWSTGTTFDGTGNYLGKNAWSIERGPNTPEQGNWGAVLALAHKDGVTNTLADLAKHTNLSLQVAATEGFTKFEVFLSTNVDGKESSKGVPFGLKNKDGWNEINIDLDAYGLNLSHINQIAVHGTFDPNVASGQILYVTDFHAYDSQTHAKRDHNDYGDAFVLISSTGETSDFKPDDSNFINEGNATLNEWSTGTTIDSEASYLGEAAWQLTQGAGWGAVIAFTGDDFGALQSFDFDMTQYKTLSFKLATEGKLKDFKLHVGSARGNAYETLLTPTPTADWQTYTVDMSKFPLDVDQIVQLAVMGSGTPGDGGSFYITDLKFSK